MKANELFEQGQVYEVRVVLEPAEGFSSEEVVRSVNQMANTLGWDVDSAVAFSHGDPPWYLERVVFGFSFLYDEIRTERQRDNIPKKLRRLSRGKPRFEVLSIEMFEPR